MSGIDPQVGLRPQARHDIVDLAVYIADHSPDAASRFLNAVEHTCDFLLANPQAGAFYPTECIRLFDLRVFQVRGFPNHLVFYREKAKGIEVLRVLHGARNVDSILRLE